VPFVTFEGVEGAGKSTQLAMAAQRLRQSGREVLETKEPGGTVIGQKIRAILLDVAHGNLDPVAEWLLYEADRRQHVRELLQGAIAPDRFLLCDRFSDTTEAYQQFGRGLDADLVKKIDALARDGLVPDLTLVYDVVPEDGLARARSRDGSVDRFEAADLQFHRRVRSAYLEIARREPRRVRLIPAAEDPDRVFEHTWRHLSVRFGL
jgi:dTMP kinase